MSPQEYTRIKDLLRKHLHEDLTPDETAELNTWIGESATRAAFIQRFTDAGHLERNINYFFNSRKNISARLKKEIPELGAIEPVPKIFHRIHFLKTAWFRYAAAILIICGIGAYLYNQTQKTSAEITSNKPVPTEKDIAPGKDGAILTLADGRKIVLDSLGNGIVAEQKGTNVLLENGKLAYSIISESDNKEVLWNTMSTPRGRQFQVILPDGTKVWLNAASWLRYPTVFIGAERRVEVNGEAYFEVVSNKQMPFVVKINNETQVQVLGTHFNINAYSDEPTIRTTLLEGKVNVIKDNYSRILQPNQQAVIKENIVLKQNINVDQVVAWKNGVFNFTNAPFDEFMRQLARWYDLDIVYKTDVPKKVFRGKLGRNLALSQILEVLSLYDIQYSLEGKTLTIN